MLMFDKVFVCEASRRIVIVIVGKIQSTAMRTDLLYSGVGRYGVEI